MQPGFDPAKANANPGRVLLGYALEHAVGEGQLVSGHGTTCCVRVFRHTRAALLYRARRIWLPRLSARLLFRPAPKLEV